VLDYCRARRRRHVLAIKGQSQPGKPPIGRPTKVDIAVTGSPFSGSALLWPVGSDGIKGWLMGRLREPGMIHFPADLGQDFYEQLTAERLVTKHVRGMAQRTWVKSPSARNEALDASVYAYAAAVYAGLKRADWAAIRKRLVPRETTEAPKEKESPAVPKTLRQRGAGFATRW
jgi:terminase, large subunit